MKPRKPEAEPQDDLFKTRLVDLINTRHPLAQLADQIAWDDLDDELSQYYSDTATGYPPHSTRLMSGLSYLKTTYSLSDEVVVARWVENPYWQYFCGETFFQHKLPINSSSLTNFRKRIGEKGVQTLLSMTLRVGFEQRALKPKDCQEIVVDTTVMEKAIAHPTDSRLFYRSRKRVVKLCKQHGVKLRQNYNRKAKQALMKAGRYGHAKQFKRMRKQVKQLKNWLGRVVRDIERQVSANRALFSVFEHELGLANRLLSQEKRGKNKLYSLHAPEVECIAKGKAKKPYEFGVKVGVVTNLKQQFVLACHTLPSRPYDGHTLYRSIMQSFYTTGVLAKHAYVDRGYKGYEKDGSVEIHLPGQRGVTQTIKRKRKRRNAIEAIIGHMKTEGALNRNYLKGQSGDAIHACLCGAGQNIRMLLRRLAAFLAWVLSNSFRVKHSSDKNCNLIIATAYSGAD